jgi:RimJ/RimL family protein N-acetyltransferase
MTEVRLATAADIPDAVAAYEKVAAEGRWIGGELPFDRDERVAKWTATVSSGEAVMFIAHSQYGETIGCASQNWLGRCGSGLLGLGMWVIEPWRGRGVGSALLSACIEWARANGAHKITLEVWPHNEPARALYRKFGFREEGYLHKHWRRRSGELWDSVVMGLLL